MVKKVLFTYKSKLILIAPQLGSFSLGVQPIMWFNAWIVFCNFMFAVGTSCWKRSTKGVSDSTRKMCIESTTNEFNIGPYRVSEYSCKKPHCTTTCAKIPLSKGQLWCRTCKCNHLTILLCNSWSLLVLISISLFLQGGYEWENNNLLKRMHNILIMTNTILVQII